MSMWLCYCGTKNHPKNPICVMCGKKKGQR